MSSVSIKWEEPPANTGGYVKWQEVADALKCNPGRWALVAENATPNTAHYLKTTYGLETRSVTTGRNYENRRADIYARYVGDSGA